MWKWNSGEADKPGGFSPEATHIGKSIVIQGEVSGSENAYVAGEVQGSLELFKGNLTVGPEARIRTNIQAPNIVVHGRVEGNLYGIKRVDLRRSFCASDIQVQKDVPILQTTKNG